MPSPRRQVTGDSLNAAAGSPGTSRHDRRDDGSIRRDTHQDRYTGLASYCSANNSRTSRSNRASSGAKPSATHCPMQGRRFSRYAEIRAWRPGVPSPGEDGMMDEGMRFWECPDDSGAADWFSATVGARYLAISKLRRKPSNGTQIPTRRLKTPRLARTFASA